VTGVEQIHPMLESNFMLDRKFRLNEHEPFFRIRPPLILDFFRFGFGRRRFFNQPLGHDCPLAPIGRAAEFHSVEFPVAVSIM
jgi:hypothetical protein